MYEHKQALVDAIVLENGKNEAEALGDVAKGLETVEWACSMPQLISGDILKVSRGVTCHDVNEPLGVVVCRAVQLSVHGTHVDGTHRLGSWKLRYFETK